SFVYLIPRLFVFRVLGIEEVAVLDAIVIHQREAIDISLLGYRAGLRGRWVCGANRDGERRHYGKAEDLRSEEFHRLMGWLSGRKNAPTRATRIWDFGLISLPRLG